MLGALGAKARASRAAHCAHTAPRAAAGRTARSSPPPAAAAAAAGHRLRRTKHRIDLTPLRARPAAPQSALAHIAEEESTVLPKFSGMLGAEKMAELGAKARRNARAALRKLMRALYKNALERCHALRCALPTTA